MKKYKTEYNKYTYIILSSLVLITLPLKENYNSMVLITYFMYLFTHLNKLSVFPLKKDFIIFILPFLFVCSQVFISYEKEFSNNLIRALPILIFPLFSEIYKKNKVSNVKLMGYYVNVASLYSLLLIIYALYRQLIFSPNFSEINWYFFAYQDFTSLIGVHPTYLGLFLCLAYTYVLNFSVEFNKYYFKNSFKIIVLLVTIFLLGSRIILLSTIIITLLIVFRNFSKISKKAKIGIIASAIFLPFFVFKTVPIVQERMIAMTFGSKQDFKYAKYGDNVAYNGGLGPRIEIWKCAIEITKNSVLFGNGFGCTQCLLNECYKDKGLDEYAKSNYQTHSQYFNNYARGGVVGLFVLLIVLLAPLYKSIQDKNYIYSYFLILIIISSFTENIFNRHFGIIFYAMFNSVLYYSFNKE